MKRVICLILAAAVLLALIPAAALAAPGDIVINAGSFPDTDFRIHVAYAVDTDHNGILSMAERSAVTEMDINGWGGDDVGNATITSLKGIEYFSELKSLVLTDCRVESLDLSANTKLEKLSVPEIPDSGCINISANTALQYLDLGIGGAAPDLSAFTALKELHLFGISSVDLSHSANLATLQISSSTLASIDLSANTRLENLDISCSKLPSINLAPCTKLGFVHVFSSKMKSIALPSGSEPLTAEIAGKAFTSIDTGARPNLKSLMLYCQALKSFDLSKNTALEELYIDSMKEIKTLGLSANTALKILSVSQTPLTALDLSAQQALTRLEVSYDVMYDETLSSLDVSSLSSLENLSLRSLNIKSLKLGSAPIKKLDIAHCAKLKTLDASGLKKLAELNFYNIPVAKLNLGSAFGVKKIMIDQCKKLKSLTLAKETSSLKTATLRGNTALAALDLSGAKKALKYLTCEKSAITSLNLKGFKKLHKAFLDNNKLKKLTLGGNDALVYLHAQHNALTSLSVTEAPKIGRILAGNNKLKGLTVKNCKELEILGCEKNRLTKLDVSKCTALRTLTCGNNAIKKLDLSKCTLLGCLSCSGNKLTSLDLSKNKKLYNLYCAKNSLKKLSLAKLKELKLIDCSHNKLSGTLKANYTNKLMKLDCHSNRLSKLYVKKAAHTSVKKDRRTKLVKT